jgi:hypothetical protein
MRHLLLVLGLVLGSVGCMEEDLPDAPDAAPSAPDACPHTREGCAGCGLDNRGCCQRAEEPRFYCLSEDLKCDIGTMDCFRYDDGEDEVK